MFFFFSCSDEEIIVIKQNDSNEKISQQKKELIDSIYDTWILNGIGYIENNSVISYENLTESQICDIIKNKLDGISIGYELNFEKHENYVLINKKYNCGESWIYNTANLNINKINDYQIRIEEYINITTIINYYVPDISLFKKNELKMWVEYDNRTNKKYFLFYKIKNT
jgi:hypothetical protein